MAEPTIICPNCKSEIKLTESLAAPIIEATRRQFEETYAQKDTDYAQREATLRQQHEALAREKESVEELVTAKLKTEREKIAAEEGQKARALLGTEMEQKATELAGLQEVLKQRDLKLAEAQKAQAEVIRQQRELSDARREMDLTIEKRVDESLIKVRDQAKKDAEEELKLKVQEKELTISSMQKQIEELRRRAEQGSQQLQGEVQELELEAVLRDAFPRDTIEPVAKGEHGGDTLHRVYGPGAQLCGTILWETKRTKNWSDGWLAKLRDDQRASKAEIAVIVSHVLPKDVESFSLMEGVWVTGPRCAVAVAMAMRFSIIELAAARRAGEGQQTKTDMVYQYLTGPRFRHRVQAIVEKFSEMQEDLDRERKTMTRLWAKREGQIRGVIESTAGMYGDLQGIAGRTLGEIEGLEMLALDGPDESSEQCGNSQL